VEFLKIKHGGLSFKGLRINTVFLENSLKGDLVF